MVSLNVFTGIGRTRFNLISLCKEIWMKIYVFLKLLLMSYEHFSIFVPRQGVIIDNGCGYGLVSLFLALESKDRQIIGIDPNKNRVKKIFKAYSKIPSNVRFEIKDIRELRIADVDCIIMEETLHHIARGEHREVLRNVYLKLRKDGTFIVRENNKRISFRFIFINLVFEYLAYLFFEKANFYSTKELKKMLEEVGFVHCEIIPSPWYFIFDVVLIIGRK